MLNRRSVLGLLAAAAMASATGAIAGEKVAFSQSAFDAAAAAGKPILVHISAVWCPTCRRQKPVIGALLSEPQFADLVVFEVDFDSQKDIVRRFGARAQSTLIAFKGEAEVGRSVGDTRQASIAELVGRTL